MPSLTALDAKNRFGQLIEMAQRSPVTITKNGRPSVVVMSAADYERRRKSAGKRVLAAMDRMAEQAARNGLTEKDLEELLRDDD
jgi:prevent-host-death family protein